MVLGRITTENEHEWQHLEILRGSHKLPYMSLRSMFLSSVYGRYMHVILEVQEVLASPNDGTRTISSFPHFVRKVSQGKLIQSKPSSYSLGGLGGRQFSECTFLCNHFLIGTENSSCSCPDASYLHFKACP